MNRDQLKRVVADLSLDKLIMSEAHEETSKPFSPPVMRRSCALDILCPKGQWCCTCNLSLSGCFPV